MIFKQEGKIKWKIREHLINNVKKIFDKKVKNKRYLSTKRKTRFAMVK